LLGRLGCFSCEVGRKYRVLEAFRTVGNLTQGLSNCQCCFYIDNPFPGFVI
jgi:hypothetical protein